MRRQRNGLWLAAGLFWTAVIGLFAWQDCSSLYGIVLEHASIEARASYNKDLVYRRWVSMQGGVYVVPSPRTPPNQFLSHLPNRDVKTLSGLELTLVNPAYMTRQVHELAAEQYGVKGHITSLSPLSTTNGPDPWEARALKALEQGAEKISEISSLDGGEYLRMIYPMRTEKPCLKCHQQQGYQVGDLRGGISVSVPLEPYMASYEQALPLKLLYYGVVWLLGIAGLVYSCLFVNRQFRVNEQSLAASRQVEEALRRQKLVLEKTQQLGGIGGWEVDLQTGARTCSDQARRIFGLSPDLAADHRSFWQMLHPDDYARVEQLWQQLLSGTPFRSEHRLVIDGEVRWVREKADVYLDETGQLERISGLTQDVTEVKHLQEKSIRAAQMASVGELSAVVAHEVNNPLSGVINYAQVLLNRSDNDPQAQEILSRIIKEGERIARTVRGVLTLSYRTSGQREARALAPIVEDALALLQGPFERKGIVVERRFVDDLPQVLCDAPQIEQVVLNIIRNAYHALLEGLLPGAKEPYLLVEATRVVRDGKAFVQLVIANNGPNISPELLGRIKEPFLTTKPAEVGTGLGLSVANDIMGSHQGYFEIESPTGEYTRMILGLPEA